MMRSNIVLSWVSISWTQSYQIGHWHSTSRPHHASAMQVPLAANQRACQFQSSMPGSPVNVQAGTCLPTDDCCLESDSARHSLRSADVQTCIVPWTYSTKLLQSLDIVCGTLYRSSCAIQISPTVSATAEGTIFFGNHGHGALWLLICSALEKHLLIYLPLDTVGQSSPQRIRDFVTMHYINPHLPLPLPSTELQHCSTLQHNISSTTQPFWHQSGLN